MIEIKTKPAPVTINGNYIADVHLVKIRNIVIRELNGWAQVYHDLYDGENDLIASRDLKLEGEIYENWGKDDEYVIDILLAGYSLEKYVEPTINMDSSMILNISNENIIIDNITN